MTKVKNDIIDFYEEKHISPVTQEIDDFSLHLKRRRKLYRQCGIPIKMFRNANVLEVGPGGGFNSLCFFEWGAKVDLVEPNSKGIEDIKDNFIKQRIPKESYHIFEERIENYSSQKKYDIVIAEGFLDAIDNQEEVICKLKELVCSGGVVVITCADDACFFIETIKRLVGVVLTRNISNYEEKVEFLTNFFTPQLKNLQGMSRKVKDWVEDQMLCPSFINGHSLSMSEAVDLFDGFFVIGSSQKMFTDYSWYKDVWYNETQNIKNQFQCKRLSLLMAGMEELILDAEDVTYCVSCFKHIRESASSYEKNLEIEHLKELKNELNKLREKIQVFPESFVRVFSDINEIIECIINEGEIDITKYKSFFGAFGRTQQYMAFEKI